MVTTQFSGCSFCFKQINGRLFAAHISPSLVAGTGGIAGGGTELARQLAGQVQSVTAGNFPSPVPQGGQLMVFGPGYSNIPNLAGGYQISQTQTGGYMTVIGLRAGANWKLFSQTVAAGKVVDVKRLL